MVAFRASFKKIKLGASVRWSFGPNPTWGSIETTTVSITHPSLMFFNDFTKKKLFGSKITFFSITSQIFVLCFYIPNDKTSNNEFITAGQGLFMAPKIANLPKAVLKTTKSLYLGLSLQNKCSKVTFLSFITVLRSFV